MYRVTIYTINCFEPVSPSPVLMSCHLHQHTCVLVPAGDDSHDPLRIAAEGWAKAIGIGRAEELRVMNAPRDVVAACTTCEGILAQDCLRPAPSCWTLNPVATSWVLDNDVQCWLLSVEALDSRRHSS